MRKFTILFFACLLLIASPAVAQEEATQPGKSIRDNLREKVEEKLIQLSRKPRSLVGKITEITNSVLILDTKAGIKQVKITDETVIVEAGKEARKTIKATDLEVGNFVVAMGYFDTKDSLTAKRILTMADTPLRAKRPVYGLVESIKDGTLVVKHPKKDGSTGSSALSSLSKDPPQGDTWTVKTSSKTRVTAKVDGKMEKVDVAAVEAGDRIIAIGEPVKNAANTITAKLIHIIPGKAKGLLKTAKPTPKVSPSPSPTP